MFAQGRRRGDLGNDRKLLLALAKDVEISGKVAMQVTEPTRQHLSGIPWEQIVEMRNRLVQPVRWEPCRVPSTGVVAV